MVWYLLVWAPAVVVVGTAVILSCAYLTLIVLMLVALVALPVLAGAIVVSPYLLVRTLYRSWPDPSGAGHRRTLHHGRAEERGTP